MRRALGLIGIFLLAQLGSTVIVMMVCALTGIMGGRGLDLEAFRDSPWTLSCSLLLNAVIVWLCMTKLKWTYRRGFKKIKASKWVYALVIALTIPSIYVVNVFSEIMNLPDTNKDLFTSIVQNPLGIVTLTLAGPFTEELVFRMGIQNYLSRRGYAPWLAIIISSLLFAVVHGNPAQMPAAMMFGFLFGWLYWRSSCMWLSFTAHVINNAIAVASIIIMNKTGENTLICLSGGLLPTMCYIIVSLIIIIIMIKLINKAFHKQRDLQGH